MPLQRKRRTKKKQHRGYYIVEGEKLVSVTTVLGIIHKYPLLLWYGKLGVEGAKKESRKAMTIGSNVHSAIENYIKGKPTPNWNEGTARANAFGAFLSWLEDNDVEFVETELEVYSLEYGFAGTLDVGAIVNGENAIIDFKCSKGIYQEVELQLQAYCKAKIEMGYEPPTVLYCVRLDKVTGKYQVKKYKPSTEVFDVFLAAKKLWMWKNG